MIKSICIGMENSKFAGQCPGAGYDALRFYNIVSKISDKSILFQSEEALKSVIKTAIEDTCDSDLAIIFYAGHGGSEKLKQFAPEEDDGKDEMIFLYDNYLVDDDIWNIISNAKGRVFLMFDCCHSETMFRCIPNVFPRGINSDADILCWSGCSDSKVSYGSSQGGQFTNSFLKYYNPNLTYEELWNKISNDQTLKNHQIVKCTKLKDDSGFNNQQIFK